MHLEPFEFQKPSNLRELESLLAEKGRDAQLLAGGTDLLVLVKEKLVSPKLIVDIGDLAELQVIRVEPDGDLFIGGGTKVSEIEHSPLVKERAPALAYAASNLGSSQVRNMATMAGNVCHASPSAETPPVLLAHDARVVLAGANGERTLPISEFFLSYRKTALKESEYLKGFLIPPLPVGSVVVYKFRGLRAAMEIDMVNVGLFLRLEDNKVAETRIAMGAVGPIPYRANKTEQSSVGALADGEFVERAAEGAAEEATPIDDVRASADYRKQMVRVLTRRGLAECLELLGTEGGVA